MANADLKSLFTSEDEYTVLELLNVLIDEVGKSMVKTAKISQDVDDGLLTLTVTLSDDSVVSSATNLNSLTDDEKETIRGLVGKLHDDGTGILVIDSDGVNVNSPVWFFNDVSFDNAPTCSGEATNDNGLITKKYADDLWATRKAQEEKCYQALKTVTKDFTRTDPVYVRIGEDGEPEIHYTMTQADGTDYFLDMDFGKATFYLHNGAIMTKCPYMFRRAKLRRIFVDSIGSSTYLDFVFSADSADSTLEEVGLFDTSKVTSMYGFLMERRAVKIVPAFDMSSLTFSDAADFYHLNACTAFMAKGTKKSLWLNSLSSLGHDAILEVFNNLGTVDKTKGITLTLGSEKLALMSDEEKLIATEKGWYLA